MLNMIKDTIRESQITLKWLLRLSHDLGCWIVDKVAGILIGD